MSKGALTLTGSSCRITAIIKAMIIVVIGLQLPVQCRQASDLSCSPSSASWVLGWQLPATTPDTVGCWLRNWHLRLASEIQVSNFLVFVFIHVYVSATCVIPWSWSCSRLSCLMWVPGTELWSPARATRGLCRRAIIQGPKNTILIDDKNIRCPVFIWGDTL